MSDDARKEASKEISKLVEEAYAALAKAEALADKHNLNFSFDPAYGMGGTYIPKPQDGEPLEDRWGDPTWGWQASSQSC